MGKDRRTHFNSVKGSWLYGRNRSCIATITHSHENLYCFSSAGTNTTNCTCFLTIHAKCFVMERGMRGTRGWSHQVCSSISPVLHCSESLNTASVTPENVETCEPSHSTDDIAGRRLVYIHHVCVCVCWQGG
jgi:hypothetical protein